MNGNEQVMNTGKKMVIGVSIVMMASAVFLWLGVAAAGQRAIMPDLTNMDLDDAEDALVETGVKKTDIEYQATDGSVLGTEDIETFSQNYIVIAQEPEAGETIHLSKHTPVYLLVKEE